MDCTTFQESEIDALYGELDAEGAAAMAEHAATCPSCAARLERLRGTRGLVLSVAVEPVASDFESRIMAAVDAGLANRYSAAGAPFAAAPHVGPMHGGAPYASAPPPMPLPMMAAAPKPAQDEGGAKIFKFMARPSFAVAATLVLVLSGAAFLMTSSARKSSPMASSDMAPAPTAVAMGAAGEAEPAPPPAAVAASPTTTPEPMASAVAIAAPEASPAPTEMSGLAMRAPSAPVVATKPGKSAAKTAAGGTTQDRAFTAAKALYDSGKYAEALPRFEALKGTNPEAELYAARCIRQTRGCAAAAPRFDTAAQTNAGTEAGNRATLEGAKCYQATNQIAEARKRYAVAKDEEGVGPEAAKALDALDAKSGAGTPSGGAHAAPRAKPAAEAPAAAPPDVMRK